MSNAIVKPITPDGLCGFDEYRQLWVWWIPDPTEPGSKQGTIIADVRSMICPICQKGWQNTSESLKDQIHLNSMDRWAHRSCEYGMAHVNNYYFWHNLVCEREFNRIGLDMKETKNLYGSSWTGPWYRIKFNHIPDHEFIFGSRKRVYHMEVTNVGKELADQFNELFKDQDVTKYRSDDDPKSWVIHAWNKDAARDYLKKFFQIITHELPATKDQ